VEIPRELTMAKFVRCNPFHGGGDPTIGRVARLMERSERGEGFVSASLGCVFQGQFEQRASSMRFHGDEHRGAPFFHR
jgi:hypothetical protein